MYVCMYVCMYVRTYVRLSPADRLALVMTPNAQRITSRSAKLSSDFKSFPSTK